VTELPRWLSWPLMSELLGAGEEPVADILFRAMSAVFPWTRFLPPDQAREFAAEFTGTALACAQLGSMAALQPVIETWRATPPTAPTTGQCPTRKPPPGEPQAEGPGRPAAPPGRMRHPVRRQRPGKRLGETLPPRPPWSLRSRLMVS